MEGQTNDLTAFLAHSGPGLIKARGVGQAFLGTGPWTDVGHGGKEIGCC